MERYRKAAERIVDRYVSAALFWAFEEDDDRPNEVKEAETRQWIIDQIAAIINEEVIKAGDVEFQEMQDAVRKRIAQGARRNSGKIV